MRRQRPRLKLRYIELDSKFATNADAPVPSVIVNSAPHCSATLAPCNAKIHDCYRLLDKYDYGDDIRCGHYYFFHSIDFRRIHSQNLGRREHLDRQVSISGFLQAALAKCDN
ncbi:unnamed protein product, partial [Mesorhabditis spiculigera]